MQAPSSAGPLTGLRVIEMAGLGPCPLTGMLLADHGADVLVIERPGGRIINTGTGLDRGKRRLSLDLKSTEGLAEARRLIDGADAVIEGFRPGVMERLGLGPETFTASHPRLVYGRVTGWGQTGPLAQAAGHDINYVALTGVLSVASRAGAPPSIPATLIGDMGGGAMLLAFGLMAALWAAQRSGRGQVVDAAMVDGVGLLSSLLHSLRAAGRWRDEPAQNFFLHGSPFYDCFECADGRFVSIGALEPAFYAELLQRLDLADVDPAAQHDHRQWPALRERVAARLREKTRDAWCALLEGTNVCFAPVLTLAEAPLHPHAQAPQRRASSRSDHAHTPRQPQGQQGPASKQALPGLRPPDELAPRLGQELGRGQVLQRTLPPPPQARRCLNRYATSCWYWATSSTSTAAPSMASTRPVTRPGWPRWPRSPRMSGAASRASRCSWPRCGTSPKRCVNAGGPCTTAGSARKTPPPASRPSCAPTCNGCVPPAWC